jgi:hypothetical protein
LFQDSRGKSEKPTELVSQWCRLLQALTELSYQHGQWIIAKLFTPYTILLILHTSCRHFIHKDGNSSATAEPEANWNQLVNNTRLKIWANNKRSDLSIMSSLYTSDKELIKRNVSETECKKQNHFFIVVISDLELQSQWYNINSCFHKNVVRLKGVISRPE